MSRLGKQPITLTGDVKVDIDGRNVTVNGPKGTLSYEVPEGVTVAQEETKLHVQASSETADMRMRHGLARSLLHNIVVGVTSGFKKQLEFQGVGYRGECKGKRLVLNLGFSHPVEYEVPEEVTVSMPDPTHVLLESIHKQLVGETAAKIRSFRPPDAYKGKGIRYVGEQISLKEGKTVG